MNDIKQLEERIAQLTELVKTGSEAIKNMETALKAAEEERDRLADQRREQEPKFERVKYVDRYYRVELGCGVSFVSPEYDCNTDGNIEQYEANNYFYTRERAQEVADKINFLLKLERLHDIYCPDYVPDWDDFSDKKHYVRFVNTKQVVKKYYVGTTDSMFGDVYTAYYPTIEIAQKVCDILNKELVEEI